jgi:predicted NUDIX family phosphoesterase
MELNLTPIENRKHAAFILAADAAFFRSSGFFVTGFTRIDEDIWLTAIQSHLAVRERGPLETNPHYRQLVPYVILRQHSPEGKPRYFLYQRMKGVGEARLDGNTSVGIGGHIEAEDLRYYRNGTEHNAMSLQFTIHKAMQREVLEEFGVFTVYDRAGDAVEGGHTYTGHSFGVILDDSNDVGKVHAGLVYLVDVGAELNDLSSAEGELEARGFHTAEDLLATDFHLEGWSQLVLRELAAIDAVQLVNETETNHPPV